MAAAAGVLKYQLLQINSSRVYILPPSRPEFQTCIQMLTSHLHPDVLQALQFHFFFFATACCKFPVWLSHAMSCLRGWRCYSPGAFRGNPELLHGLHSLTPYLIHHQEVSALFPKCYSDLSVLPQSPILTYVTVILWLTEGISLGCLFENNRNDFNFLKQGKTNECRERL